MRFQRVKQSVAQSSEAHSRKALGPFLDHGPRAWKPLWCSRRRTYAADGRRVSADPFSGLLSFRSDTISKTVPFGFFQKNKTPIQVAGIRTRNRWLCLVETVHPVFGCVLTDPRGGWTAGRFIIIQPIPSYRRRIGFACIPRRRTRGSPVSSRCTPPHVNGKPLCRR